MLNPHFLNTSTGLVVIYDPLSYQILLCQKNRTFTANIQVSVFIENQHMHQNDQSIVMLTQTLLHVSAHQHNHQGAHVILTSCLYVGVHYRKNNGGLSKLAPVNNLTQWI
jgi:hypothetical protein